MQKYTDSPAPIENAFDLIALMLAARKGDYPAHKRLANIDRGVRRSQEEHAQWLFRRNASDIEIELGKVRYAIVSGREDAEGTALAQIGAILKTMPAEDQKKAWQTIAEWNFCGHYAFVTEHYRKQKA
jgi:hypothetical protein